MENLTFLLYILSLSISSVKPAMVEALLDWSVTTSNIDVADIDIKRFCVMLKLNSQQTQKFLGYYSSQQSVESLQKKFFESLQENNIKAINIFDALYPKQLLQIPDPPLILYCRGQNIELLSATALAMVGSRRASGYGKLVVEKLIASLTNTNITIISGLAYGIDAHSHQMALKNNLPTVAVLGSGIDNETIYPKANFNLAQEILNNGGLLISEYPPNTAAINYQFVARNRIIAGLSQATVIVEAAARSGALLTADFALEYNRSVYAVPGQIFTSQSQGTNALIKQGAQILNSVDDLYLEFNIAPTQVVNKNYPVSTQQLAVLKCMQSEGETIHLEDLIEKCSLPLSEILSCLTELELNKIIIQSSPQIYQKLI